MMISNSFSSSESCDSSDDSQKNKLHLIKSMHIKSENEYGEIIMTSPNDLELYDNLYTCKKNLEYRKIIYYITDNDLIELNNDESETLYLMLVKEPTEKPALTVESKNIYNTSKNQPKLTKLPKYYSYLPKSMTCPNNLINEHSHQKEKITSRTNSFLSRIPTKRVSIDSVLPQKEPYITKKRASIDVMPSRIDPDMKRASVDKIPKRTSVDKVPKRTSVDKVDKFISTDNVEKCALIDDVPKILIHDDTHISNIIILPKNLSIIIELNNINYTIHYKDSKEQYSVFKIKYKHDKIHCFGTHDHKINSGELINNNYRIKSTLYNGFMYEIFTPEFNEFISPMFIEIMKGQVSCTMHVFIEILQNIITTNFMNLNNLFKIINNPCLSCI